MKIKNILKIKKESGQSIAEYTILFVAVVTVIIIAINGPIRNSLQNTFNGLIDAIRDSVEALI